MSSKLFNRNLQNSFHNHPLYTDKQPQGLVLEPINKHVEMITKKRQQMMHGWMHTQSNQIDTKEQADKNKAEFIQHQSHHICLVCSSFPRTEKTEKNLFYLHVIVSELVGGMRERAWRDREERVSAAGKAMTARCSKIAWIVRLSNSLFLPDPNFNHSGWIIHSRPMTCREGDKESLLYFDSHNKFMTQCLKGRRNR